MLELPAGEAADGPMVARHTCAHMHTQVQHVSVHTRTHVCHLHLDACPHNGRTTVAEGVAIAVPAGRNTTAMPMCIGDAMSSTDPRPSRRERSNGALAACPNGMVVQEACHLHLDTHLYNGHTTMAEAIATAVPVLAYPHERVTSRISASVLSGIRCVGWMAGRPISHRMAMHIGIADSVSRMTVHISIADGMSSARVNACP